MKLKNIFSIAIGTVTLLLVGCNIQKSNPLDLRNPLDLEVPVLSSDQITFKVIQSQVFKDHCVSCHSEKSGNKGDVNLETYENVVKVAQAIRAEVFNRTMPPRRLVDLKLSEAQIKLVIDWIDSGAKEHGEQGPPSPIPPEVEPVPPVVDEEPVTGPFDFVEVFEKVIKVSCVKCHSEKGGNKGKLNMETYEAVFAAREKIRHDIEEGFMPPRRSKPLTDNQRKMILEWLQAGAKERKEQADDSIQPQE